MLPEVIRTPRTILRPYRASDLDDVFEYAGDAAWRRYLTSVPDPYTRADAESFLASQTDRDRGIHPVWAIEFQGRVVGGLGMQFSHDHRVGELGYGLAPRLWGQGLAVEVAGAIITASFMTYPELVRVRATTDSRNARSLRVMAKLGMQREALLRSERFSRGELVDEVICGLLRHEWRGQ